MAAIILIILCLLGGSVLSSPKYVERLSTTLNTTTNRSNVDRIWAWKASWDMFKDYPVNGVGLNNWAGTTEMLDINMMKRNRIYHMRIVITCNH